MSDTTDDQKPPESLLNQLMKLSGQLAGSTIDLAVSTATLSAMFGESWLRNALATGMSPERLEAMAEAGHFLRDARETTGLSVRELADRLGLSDPEVLKEVEQGETLMPVELMFRAASLLARHDPIPFLIKFLRTYNPQLEQRLESWGVMAVPKHFERERRFVNLYRQHDWLRDLSDDEYDRFLNYMQSSTDLVVDVMQREKEANQAARRRPARSKSRPRPKASSRARGKPE